MIRIVHKNNLILDNLAFNVITYDYVQVTYTKPYSPKYFGLVVEWIVNNLKPLNIKFIAVGYQDGRAF